MNSIHAFDTFRPMRVPFVVAVLSALLGAGCHSSSSGPTTPSSTTATPASPTTTENFADTLPVSGSKFYSFNVSVYGTVNVTLVSISGVGVPSTVFVGLGIGTPSGTTCTQSTSATVQTGSVNQVTANEQPGLYCVVISDVGNLFAPAAFTITIAHP